MKVSATALTVLSAPAPGLKAGVQRTVGHQAGDEITMNAVNGGERAAHQNPAIGLADDGIHCRVRAGKSVQERGVQRTVGIQPGNPASPRPDRRP